MEEALGITGPGSQALRGPGLYPEAGLPPQKGAVGISEAKTPQMTPHEESALCNFILQLIVR